jgi:rhodanese-related sulfurtransferase
MKRLLLPLLLIVIIGNNSYSQKSETLTANEFEKKLSATKEKTVLDVRTAEEFSQGHLPDAVMIDYYQDNFKERLTKLDKTKPVFVYCLGGGRSSSASKVMKELGFSQVFNLEGGYKEWKSSGKKIVK